MAEELTDGLYLNQDLVISLIEDILRGKERGTVAGYNVRRDVGSLLSDYFCQVARGRVDLCDDGLSCGKQDHTAAAMVLI